MEKTLGMRIGEYRRAKGLKQDELAEMLGVSPQAVSKWENNISCPDIMLLPELSRILGVSTDELLSGKTEVQPKVQYVPDEKRKSFDEMMLVIKVFAKDEDDEGKEQPVKVRVNLPLPLCKVFMESGGTIENIMGGSVPAGSIDFEQIMKLVESGVVGKLVEVDVDDGGGEGVHVEIVVE